jgi:hypothetical protein
MTKCTVSSSTARNVGPATRPPTDEECGSGSNIFDPHTIPFFIHHNDNAAKNLTIGVDRHDANVLKDRENIDR